MFSYSHLIGRVLGHRICIGDASGDHGLGAGNKPGVIEDQDDRVILGVGISVTKELFRTGSQRNPSLTYCLLLGSFHTNTYVSMTFTVCVKY